MSLTVAEAPWPIRSQTMWNPFNPIQVGEVVPYHYHKMATLPGQ